MTCYTLSQQLGITALRSHLKSEVLFDVIVSIEILTMYHYIICHQHVLYHRCFINSLTTLPLLISLVSNLKCSVSTISVD